MFENNSVTSFFAGMLVMAGLVVINNSNTNSVDDIVMNNTVDVYENQAIVENTNKVNKLENSNIDKVSSDKVSIDKSRDDKNNITFEAKLLHNVYMMDKGVTEDKVLALKSQLDRLPKVLLDKFYNSGFRVNLYSDNGSVSEGSHLSTKNKVLKMTYRGISTNKFATEFAYYLDYVSGISKNSKFVEVFELEGKGINSTPKGYLIKSFTDYVLRGDSLSSQRPVTYKYLKDYFIVMSGGTVIEDKHSDDAVNDESNSTSTPDGTTDTVVDGVVGDVVGDVVEPTDNISVVLP